MMRKLVGLLTASLLLMTAVPLFAADTGTAFTDVPNNHWAAPAVNLLAEKGVFEGTGRGFEGPRPMTRYEVAMALARMLDVIDGMIKEGNNLDAIKKAIMDDPAIRAALKGDAGTNGTNGTNGINGTNGTNGTNGAKGADGVNGLNGKDGAKGDPGTPANTVTVNPINQTISPLTDAQKATLDSASKFFGSYPSIDALNKMIKDPRGLTDDERATLVKVKELLTNYGPEISNIRSDIRSLQDDVAKLKGVSGIKDTEVTVSMTGGIRYGVQGPSNAINSDIWNGIAPEKDDTLSKDVLKGMRYGVHTANINIDLAQVKNKLNAHATIRLVSPILLGDVPPLGAPFDGFNPPAPATDLPSPYTTPYYGNIVNQFGTNMVSPDAISVWEWYGEYTAKILGTPVQFTGGRKVLNVDRGLLIDTSHGPTVGLTADFASNNFTFEGHMGLLDRISNLNTVDPGILHQDLFTYVTTNWEKDTVGTFKDVNVNGAILFSGFGSQRGASFGASATLPWGNRNIFFSGAVSDNGVWGTPPNDTGRALIAGIDIFKDWHSWTVSAKYGKINANYRPVYSALYPYAAVNAYDTNWIDREMFLDPENVTSGFEAKILYEGIKNYTFGLRAYGGWHLSTTDADRVIIASVKKQLNDSVSINALYGWRQLDLEKPGVGGSYNAFRVGMDFAL